MAKQRTLKDGPCEHCGTTFRPKTTGQRFCGAECWYASRKAARMVECEACRKVYERFIPTQKTCCLECANKLKTASKTCVCAQCSAEFVRPHGKRRTYCSRRCAMLARSGIKRNGAYRHPEGHELRHSSGYIQEKRNGKWVLQHRLIMESVVGRELSPEERVHHKNENRQDNRPENLELWVGVNRSKKDPHGVRLVDKVLDIIDSLTHTERALVERKLADLKKQGKK